MKKHTTRILALVIALMTLLPVTAAFAATGDGVYSGSKLLGPSPEQVLLTFDSGSPVTAYAVNILDYVSELEDAVEWSTEKISFGSTRGNYQKLKGVVNDCYGLAVVMFILEKSSDQMCFKVGLLKDRKGDYGKYHNEVCIPAFDYDTLKCYNREPKTINGFKSMACGVRSGSYNGGVVAVTLYFASETAAEAYIRSIAVG